MTIIKHAEYAEDHLVLANARSYLLPWKGTVTRPESRTPYKALMGQVPAAEGVEYEAATIGGVSGWSVRPDSALSGQAIVYLHGGAYIVGSAEAYQNFVGHIAKATHTAAFIPDYS